MDRDAWLDKWLGVIGQRSARGPVLELGCGNGWDTLELLKAGCKVIASDLSTGNPSAAKLAAPHADNVQLDHGRPLPFADHTFSLLLASLSLHYFTWTVTLQIASELRRCLQADGVLLARFNSTKDVNYGAGSGLQIEPNFYQVQNGAKRFFDEASVRAFLHGWDIQYLEESVIHRYEKPKSVWEVMAVLAG